MSTNNLQQDRMDQAGELPLERRATERRSAAQMIDATNYELAIRERDEALEKLARLSSLPRFSVCTNCHSIDGYEIVPDVDGDYVLHADVAAAAAPERSETPADAPVGEVRKPWPEPEGCWHFQPFVGWESIGDGTKLYTRPAPASSSAAPSVPRYELVETQYGSGYMAHWDKALELDPDGEWCKYADVIAVAPAAPSEGLPYPAMVKGAFDYYTAEQMHDYARAAWVQALAEADIIHKGLIKMMAESALAAPAASPAVLTDADICDFFNERHFYPENLTLQSQAAFYSAVRELLNPRHITGQAGGGDRV